VRLTVHNGEATAKHEFFKTNIARNLAVPDISGAMVPRVRLPDLMRDKSVLIAHQRFRPLKSFLLDAIHLGIPMVHNCALVKNLGAPYYYELNQISQAYQAWRQLTRDYTNKAGFFNPSTATIRKHLLQQRFSPAARQDAYATALTATMAARLPSPVPGLLEAPVSRNKKLLPFAYSESKEDETRNVGKSSVPPVLASQQKSEPLRVAFCEMWADFQPSYNFFTLLLGWASGRPVVVDETNPQVVVYGPFSGQELAKYASVPKVYFSGEGGAEGETVMKGKAPNTFLHLGFDYTTDEDYIRFPLWQLEINWFGADVNRLVNPKPVALADCLRVNPDLVKRKSKFCAFVATNPQNPQRNEAFKALSTYKHVDAGGRLFCNLPGGPIPAGLGGGGGELAKTSHQTHERSRLQKDQASIVVVVSQRAKRLITK
jgi:hypothetical protein